MNLAIRGIDAQLEQGDTFLNDHHPDLKADFVLANPPFNVSDWSGELLRDDIRWKYGVPPVGNANYAWLQHFIHKLNPTGTAGIVLANGSMNSNTSGEGDIRRNMIEAGIVDCMVALPAQLFYNTMIPACLWFLARDRTNHKFRDRFNEILFIDARKLGSMVTRRNKEFTNEDIAKIANTYHAWRGEGDEYSDQAGFCKSATLDEVRGNNYVLMPGRYVGTEEAEDDGVPFEEKMTKLTAQLSEQFAKGNELQERIRENLKGIGYDI
jgi:type I restriction enzyme M protein